MNNEVTVFAPATVANLAVGFDILGLALSNIGDIVRVKKISEPKVIIENTDIPTDPLKNTAGKPLVQMIEDFKLNFGFSVKIEKGISIGSGMGGSAASAVGAVVAASGFLSHPLTLEQKFHYALIGEEVSAGSKIPDNVGPCLYGGIVASVEQKIHSLVVPDDLCIAVVNPFLVVETKMARGILKTEIPLKEHIKQSSYLLAFSLALQNKNYSLMKSITKDVIIEPQRAHLIPNFYEIQNIALSEGAIASSIAGAGPSIFAFCQGIKSAEAVSLKMKERWIQLGQTKTQNYFCPINMKGAYVVSAK